MSKNVKNTIKNKVPTLLLALGSVVILTNVFAAKAYADCETNYGGGETCTYNSHFKIQKWVKLEGDSSWKDDVLVDLNDDDENDKRILFKVQVTANVTNADGVDVDKINFDDMKMKDNWPDELKFLDDESKNDLTEEWDDFKPGETKTFYFTAKIKSDEKNKDGDFEKCVVNKASLYYQGDFQGSDDAVVCYKKGSDVLGASTELPETGFLPVEGIVGLLMTAAGVGLKLKKK